MDTRAPMWPAARIAFGGALLLFIATIVIGILNGLDVYTPDHDTLIGHVHGGTLGWITLALSGMGLLLFTSGRTPTPDEVAKGRTMAWALALSIAFYVAAFYAGDAIPGDRISRPIAGTILLVVLVMYLMWLFKAQKSVSKTVARLGLKLSYISVVIGAVLGIILGIFTARGEVPGLSEETADAVAGAHPPAMVIGYLFLAAFAMIEWLLGDTETGRSRAGVVQMWLLFTAGLVVNIGFVTGSEDALLGPANMAMIAGVIILLVRRRTDLKPSAWKGSGTGFFPRFASLYLLVYLVLLTVIAIKFVSGDIDVDALTPEDEGLIIAFDHVMFLGVMTNVLFGALAAHIHGRTATMVDRILMWGVNIGVGGFAVGLIMVEALPKRIFTPLMGTALLIGIISYLRELSQQGDRAAAA